jgi:hypothetical protein
VWIESLYIPGGTGLWARASSPGSGAPVSAGGIDGAAFSGGELGWGAGVLVRIAAVLAGVEACVWASAKLAVRTKPAARAARERWGSMCVLQ